LQNIALSEENNNARNKKEKLRFQNRPETDQDRENNISNWRGEALGAMVRKDRPAYTIYRCL
jgi:hypothetical protein